ncbi:zinc transporter ZIP11-like [Branchiostoma floridae]|uniref:Zinc transporter ZIP11 n=1 Tax=Branchiostoma floridae TaxID=7739 RepID=A0A9J7N983_BRAFL|nr:zinc transporter ZIP11-like [Branchiostoma floridae]
MIAGQNPVVQALLGTLLTWGLTALGASLVFVFTSGKRKVLDASLGFAAGVMLAASYWSLLSPAIEMAEQSQTYGAHGEFAFIPVAIGFALGAVFVYMSDVFLPYLGVSSPNVALALSSEEKFHAEEKDFTTVAAEPPQDSSFSIENGEMLSSNTPKGPTHRRKTSESHKVALSTGEEEEETSVNDEKKAGQASISWRRIMLLIIAITVHNIPEGLAVGVGFAAVGKTPAATFESARNLAWGIGIQNFPEGLAVSLPLRGSGMSVWKSFWYGQLSGMVEPLAGVFGAVAMVIAEPLLPYALAFAAGAMVYVVVDDIIPEANTSGNAKLASWGCIVGFIVMMSLDVGLG